MVSPVCLRLAMINPNLYTRTVMHVYSEGFDLRLDYFDLVCGQVLFYHRLCFGQTAKMILLVLTDHIDLVLDPDGVCRKAFMLHE